MDLLIEREGRLEQRTLADGEHRLDEADGVPTRLGLALFVEGARLSIEAAAPIRVGGVLLPPRLRRLVMPGEPMEPVQGCVLRIRPEVAVPAPATRAVVRRLLEAGDAQVAARLVCLTGLDAGRTLPLGEKALVIGRGEGADLRLRDRAISRLHARVCHEDSAHSIEDLQTANGVHVNGARVIGRLVLEEGALVELGQTLLRYSSGRAAPVDVSPVNDAAPPPVASNDEAQAPGNTAAPDAPLPALATRGSVVALARGQEADEEGSPQPPSEPAFSTRRRLLLASGAALFLLGIALTFGCLTFARGARAPGRLDPSASALRAATGR